MNTRHLCLAAILGTFALAGCATNDVEKPMTNQGETKHFKELDRSGDNFVTRDEIPADNELLLGFENWDLNDDGQISEHEFGEYIEDLPD